MAAALALMESPAIILAVVLANTLRQRQSPGGQQVLGDGTASLGGPRGLRLGKVLHESFTDGAQLLLAYAVVAPLVHASLALGLGALLGLPLGDVILLMVLSASASYIAVPAVLRYAIPEARPPLYSGLSLGLTFPLNTILGIPLYSAVAHAVL